MLKTVKSWLGLEKSNTSDNYTINTVGEIVWKGEVIPQYPPYVKGFPAAPVSLIVESQKEQITSIFNAMEFSKPEFDALVLPVITNVIAYAHLLPASERHHHRHAGGFVHHSLEAGFNAVQMSRMRIFGTGNSVRERRDNEERWRVAAFLVGLLHDIGKPVSDYGVTDKTGELRWQPYVQSLEQWLQEKKLDRYVIHWVAERHKKHESHSSFMLHRVLTEPIMSYLCRYDSEILQAIELVIAGKSLNHPLAGIMMKADQASVALDLKRNQVETASTGLGVPVERYIFDAIKSLISSNYWSVNRTGAKVWVVKNLGVFVDVKKGSEDIYNEIQRMQMPGIPRKADDISVVLIERGYAERYESEEGLSSLYWELRITAQGENGASVTSKQMLLKLVSTDFVFEGAIPAPIEGEVVAQVGVQTTDEVSATKANHKKTPKTDLGVTSTPVSETVTVESTEESVKPAEIESPMDFDKLMEELEHVEGKYQPALQAELKRPEAELNEPPPVNAESIQTSEEEQSEFKFEDGEDSGKFSREKNSGVEIKSADDPKEHTGELNLLPAQPSVNRNRRKKKLTEMEQASLDAAKQKQTELKKQRKSSMLNLSPEPPAVSLEDAVIERIKETKVENAPGLDLKPTAIVVATNNSGSEEVGTSRKKEGLRLGPAPLPKMEPTKERPIETLREASEFEPEVAEVMPDHILERIPDDMPDYVFDFLTESAEEEFSVPTLDFIQSNAETETELETTGELMDSFCPQAAQQAFASQDKPSATLDDMQQLLKGLTSNAVKVFSREIQKVLTREVPLGVSIEPKEHSFILMADLLDEITVHELLNHESFNQLPNGNLEVTGEIHQIWTELLARAQEAAESDAECPFTSIGPSSAESVTSLSEGNNTSTSKLTAKTPEEVVQELIRQLRSGGAGALVSPDYNQVGGYAKVSRRKTLELIREVYPHVSGRRLTRAFLEQGLKPDGTQLKISL